MLYDSKEHKSVYLDLKFNEIEYSSLDKISVVNELTCLQVSNLYGEVIYLCDEEKNRILDLSDNIKAFLTSCNGISSKQSPTLDDQIKSEKNELANMLTKLNKAVKMKNDIIKDEYGKNREKLVLTQDKQMQALKQRILLEQVIQARENEEYRQIEKLISELELQKEKEKVQNIISEVERSKYRQKKLIQQEQELLNNTI